VRKTTCLAGAVMVSSGLVAAGAPAFADSADNDGVNAGNDNNLILLPVQTCDVTVTAVGSLIPLQSPQTNNCVNAPIVDHPQASRDDQPPDSTNPPGNPVPPGNSAQPDEPPVVAGARPVGHALPKAPTPAAVPGHHAVTG
jgi:hypothetical protein